MHSGFFCWKDYFCRSLSLAKIACSRMKKHSSTAVMMFAQDATSLPLNLTREEMVPLIKTPNRVHTTLPTPPVSRVPPITAEEMASISRPVAWVGVPHMVFRQKHRPPRVA